jgi:hypothetical protein
MRWLHEHGVIANYQDYLALPFRVLQECRLVMEAHAAAEAAERARRQTPGGPRRGFRR